MTSTNSESTSTELLKADAVGRVHRKPEEIDAILDEFEASAMSGAQFARHYGIKYPTFASWRTKRREQRECGAIEQKFTFLEVTTQEKPSSEAICIEIGDSIRFEVQTQNQAVVAALMIRELIQSK